MTKIQKLKRSIKIWKYSFIVGAILLTVFVSTTIFEKYSAGELYFEAIVVLTITCIIFLLVIYFALRSLYVKIKKTYENEIQNEELKDIISKEYNLKEDSYTEIYLRDEDSEGIHEKVLREKLEAKYYAKLISYDEIEVILQDKDGDLLDDPEIIDDYIYFKEHYKL